MGDRVTFRRIINLYKIAAKMDLAWLMRDSLFAILAISSDVISTVAAVTGVFLLAWRFDGIGGMDKYEVLLMLGYSTVIGGMYMIFFGMNNGHVSRIIGRGQLEHMMVQPLPLSVQLTTMGFIPFTGSSNLISGVVIMSIAVSNLGITVTWWWIASVALNVLLTLTILLSLLYLSSSITFYAPVQAEEITSYLHGSLTGISNFPLSGMPKVLQMILISVIPSGLLAWLPTLALLGKSPLGMPAVYPLIFAVITATLATIFFRKGLRYYVKKGTNRYSSMGHRR